MKEVSAKTQRKGDWTPSEESFKGFLIWLDQGTDTEGRSYLEMRERLVTYFDRKNCSSPDELADETLNRVTRRLEEEGYIESEAPAKYCYTVARYVSSNPSDPGGTNTYLLMKRQNGERGN